MIYEDDVARTSAEEELSALLSEEAEKAEQEAKVMRRRRLTAVGPYVMLADRRSAGWKICDMPELALVKKGLHIRSFMRGIGWRVAALFEENGATAPSLRACQRPTRRTLCTTQCGTPTVKWLTLRLCMRITG